MEKYEGIPTEVFTTQFIGNSTDLIKSFIFNQYIDNQISYVLLVGDTDNVATFWPDGQTPSDLMYGYLDGDDAYPEILIGRFSAESNEDIQVQVERVLRYEKYMNTEAEWYNKGIGIASNEGEGMSDDGESDFIHMDNIRERLINYNYTSIDQAYDIYNVSSTQVYDFINSGRGIINYTGHGSTNSWISSGFSIQDINQLNNVDKYPFILSVSCNTGASQYGESMAEAWLNASQNLIPTGAISVAASSSLMQWAPPMECQDEFNDILTKTYEDKQIYSFGGIFYNSIIKMIESYGDNGVEEAKYWHVYGDPSTLIRTDVPSVIDVSYNDILTIGQTSMNLFTDEDGLVATISQNGKILSTSVSQNGLISIPLIDLDIEVGVYDLTIVGYNKSTYVSDIIFIEPEIGLLVVNNLEFNQLNHNLAINSGSDVIVSFDISNEGLESVNQVELKLETEDPFIVIHDYADSLNQVLVDESITHEMHIMVSNNTPDNHSAFVNLVMKAGELEWIFPFILNIKSPEINVSTSLLSTQNEDRIWRPGEEATLSFVVSNIGSGNMNYPIGFDIEWMKILQQI